MKPIITPEEMADRLDRDASTMDVANFCAFLAARGEAIEAEIQPKTAELPKGVAQFTKKPVTINAIQWDGKNLYEVISFTQGVPNTRSERAQDAWDDYAKIVEREGLHIDTLEGKMLANVGDWIIRGVKGEHYPCKPDIFAATYEPATAPQAEVQAEPVAQLIGVDEYGPRLNWFKHWVDLPKKALLYTAPHADALNAETPYQRDADAQGAPR